MQITINGEGFVAQLDGEVKNEEHFVSKDMIRFRITMVDGNSLDLDLSLLETARLAQDIGLAVEKWKEQHVVKERVV